MRWPISSHTATLTITLGCRAFAIAASTIEFASARVSVTTCSVKASANNRKEPSASQVPRQLHKLAALLRARQFLAALVRSLREECECRIFLNADHTHSLAKAEAGFRRAGPTAPE